MHNRNHGSVYGNLTKPPPFYLGKIGGNIINGFAIAVLIVYLVSAAFPTELHPTTNLNELEFVGAWGDCCSCWAVVYTPEEEVFAA